MVEIVRAVTASTETLAGMVRNRTEAALRRIAAMCGTAQALAWTVSVTKGIWSFEGIEFLLTSSGNQRFTIDVHYADPNKAP